MKLILQKIKFWNTVYLYHRLLLSYLIWEVALTLAALWSLDTVLYIIYCINTTTTTKKVKCFKLKNTEMFIIICKLWKFFWLHKLCMQSSLVSVFPTFPHPPQLQSQEIVKKNILLNFILEQLVEWKSPTTKLRIFLFKKEWIPQNTQKSWKERILLIHLMFQRWWHYREWTCCQGEEE